jgi:hypothetical protein
VPLTTELILKDKRNYIVPELDKDKIMVGGVEEYIKQQEQQQKKVDR